MEKIKIRDRIRELRRVPAKELIANPKNWRIHPEKQARLLSGALKEIGYADALIARENEEGKLVLIDGHLRAETTPDAVVPVLVLDVSEQEADKLLALLDPLSAMAQTDEEMLQSLTAELDSDEEAIREYFDSVRLNGEEEAEAKEPAIPELFQIVVECESEEDQREIFEQFQRDGLNCRLLNL